MLGHSKEIISADVYGDTAEIIEDCLTTCSSEFTDARTVILAFMEPSTVREDVRNIK